MLADLARSQGFRAIVEGPPDVGGRYSALSVFGLLPAALHGVDLDGLLSRAARMAEACRRPATENPGLQLGAAIGEAALAGRDKLTILTSPRLASLGDWIEQLVAESTGKAGRGIVPVVGEPIGAARDYGADRQFVFITLADDPDPTWRRLAGELEELGHPGVHIELATRSRSARSSCAGRWRPPQRGSCWGSTRSTSPTCRRPRTRPGRCWTPTAATARCPSRPPLVAEPGIAAYGDPAALGDDPVTVGRGRCAPCSRAASDGDYFALLAYLPADPGTVERLQRMRALVRDRTGLATTLGFGPRFLHSTGQLHKGGPASGIFLQLTGEPRRDLPIPGWQESFGTLIAAQAAGDLAALQRRGRRVLRLHLADPAAGLVRLEAMMHEALGANVRA